MRRRLLLAAALALPALVFAQGALTPPGAPAPTMKTLDQLEARTPLGVVGTNTSTLTISQPGSYVLMGNVTVASGNGIVITAAAQNVTLDLNGFTVSSTASPANGTGIYLSTGSNFTIRNGHLRGGVMQDNGATFTAYGFINGIDAVSIHNVRVEQVSVEGVAGYGISLHNGDGIISSCSARYCGTTGLRANQVLDSIALKCGDTAIHAGTAPDVNGIPVANGTAVNCTGESLAGGRGIFATTATNCYGTSASGPGIEAKIVTSSSGQSTSGNGIQCDTATDSVGTSSAALGLNALTATNCSGVSTSATGLIAGSATNCRGSSSGYGYGLQAVSATNCQGVSASGSFGLYATHTAENCRGSITSTSMTYAKGLRAWIATNCYGQIGTASGESSIGLSAVNATNCYGEISNSDRFGCGLSADQATGCSGSIAPAEGVTLVTGLQANTANNCRGFASTYGYGLSATVASNCIGSTNAGTGIYAQNATNCSGSTTNGTYGLQILGTASFCRGENYGGATAVALKAAVAIGCTVDRGVTEVPAGMKFFGTP